MWWGYWILVAFAVMVMIAVTWMKVDCVNMDDGPDI